MQAAEDGGPALHTIDDDSGEQRAKTVDPRERAPEQSELHVIQAHLLLEQGKTEKIAWRPA